MAALPLNLQRTLSSGYYYYYYYYSLICVSFRFCNLFYPVFLREFMWVFRGPVNIKTFTGTRIYVLLHYGTYGLL
jgi:hypothetical protein